MARETVVVQPCRAYLGAGRSAGALHHLWVEDESVVELHSTGPFDTHLN